MEKVGIIGAGLVGSLQALFLAKRGFKVSVFEKRPDQRKTEFLAGRSINLALSDRGWKALDHVGIGDDIRKVAIPMYRRTMHDENGKLSYQDYGKEGQAIYSVSRGGLNQKLMNLAEPLENIDYFFNLSCQNIDLKKNEVTFKDKLNGNLEKHQFDRIFGTDGAFSKVRLRLMKTDRFNYEQSFLEHGYKELTIPPLADGSHQLDKNTLHIWPRGGFMLIALPNLDGTFTCTLFLPFEGKDSFENLNTPKDVNSFFEQHFPDTLDLIPQLQEEFFENPTSSLVTIRCKPYHYQDKILMMGDACHAIVPFYGQGMNSGFEDCTVMDEIFDECGNDWKKAFKLFSERRKKDADAISDLALYNFIEMRDLVGDDDFLLRKKIESRFYEKHPDQWMPLYSMVTFSHTPYSEALAIGNKQRKIMNQVMSIDNINDIWDSEIVEKQILDSLSLS
ncbi:MAG: FAD-dependent monooxygenase [Flavobacteriales bacterium]|nr:FAD-dependent monooxygenase [Flavobacteriales bacterium]